MTGHESVAMALGRISNFPDTRYFMSLPYRCPPEEFKRRWAPWGIDRVWNDQEDVLPCRVYLRHCVLAARSLGPEAAVSFLVSFMPPISGFMQNWYDSTQWCNNESLG